MDMPPPVSRCSTYPWLDHLVSVYPCVGCMGLHLLRTLHLLVYVSLLAYVCGTLHPSGLTWVGIDLDWEAPGWTLHLGHRLPDAGCVGGHLGLL